MINADQFLDRTQVSDHYFDHTGKALQKEAVRILKSSPGPVILSGMTDPTPSPYELVVRACTLHAGRYRWDIRQIGMPMQSSMESFATAQEAHTDGRQVIEKLTQVWKRDSK